MQSLASIQGFPHSESIVHYIYIKIDFTHISMYTSEYLFFKAISFLSVLRYSVYVPVYEAVFQCLSCVVVRCTVLGLKTTLRYMLKVVYVM